MTFRSRTRATRIVRRHICRMFVHNMYIGPLRAETRPDNSGVIKTKRWERTSLNARIDHKAHNRPRTSLQLLLQFISSMNE